MNRFLATELDRTLDNFTPDTFQSQELCRSLPIGSPPVNVYDRIFNPLSLAIVVDSYSASILRDPVIIHNDESARRHLLIQSV